MKTLELFCGSKSFTKVSRALGNDCYTIDNDSSFNPDSCIDVLDFNVNEEYLDYDIIWASPPCTSFSIASVSHHWNKKGNNYFTKSHSAVFGLKLLDKTIEIISVAKPIYWFIENPRGLMRKIINPIFEKYGISEYYLHTVSYCQYGDSRMKPTDIWTNFKDWKTKPICKNGMSCHVSAPRGSKTGTQGLANAKDRSVIPRELFTELFNEMKGVV